MRNIKKNHLHKYKEMYLHKRHINYFSLMNKNRKEQRTRNDGMYIGEYVQSVKNDSFFVKIFHNGTS